MKIILIAEGSYPYVFGGVAGWMQTLISAMEEHEFEVVAISASRREKRPVRYELPPNLTRIHDVYMDDVLELPREKKPRLGKQEEKLILDWFDMQPGSERALPLIADRAKLGSPHAFLKSDPLWELLVRSYRREAPHDSFSAYFQAWRSMYVPALFLLRQTYPAGDMYHAVSTGYAGLIAASLCLKHGTPFILTEHGLYAEEREQEILQADGMESAIKARWISYFYYLAQCAYNTADKTVALHDAARRNQLRLGLPPDRSLVIPNGIRYDTYSGPPRGTDLPGKAFVFGALARVVPVKDIKTLLHAAKMASREIPDMQLWIMGPADEDRAYYDDCVKLAADLQIGRLVQFMGRVQPEDVLTRVDALVLSSVSEGQPLAVLEGMAAGIPWICTDVGACRELLEGADADTAGAAGFIVPPADPAAIAEKMILLYRSPDLRLRLGQAGRTRVRTHYRLDRSIDAYRRLYREVAADGRHRL
ncbi:GT4 family glycosyltransferase PelF [Paenibacillus hamazuiensis]|uniref:GT4 family glycosyltransferase PelF n=1 Tax=Paenibacillus hamazuiensis TaxID=2936508 RepID=UPI00200EA8C1|nr:GT4 family glycosyltransferase PelF [Paenibacillus hamazuiensis]